MAKADRYSTAKGEADPGLDELSRKLADDLRFHIRKLGSVPLFSEEWFGMADVFGRIATVSDVESKLAEGKEDKTLWETEEQALRYLMEDGKLNLCLRNLVDFKVHQRRAKAIGGGPVFDFATECDKFERGLGVVLNNAWKHVEAIQTTDLSMLINHIADTIDYCLEVEEDLYANCSAGDLHQRQDLMVFSYLFHIMRQLEEVKVRTRPDGIHTRCAPVDPLHLVSQRASCRAGEPRHAVGARAQGFCPRLASARQGGRPRVAVAHLPRGDGHGAAVRVRGFQHVPRPVRDVCR